MLSPVQDDFGNPQDNHKILEQQFGEPCDCKGGKTGNAPLTSGKVYNTTDCTSFIAYRLRPNSYVSGGLNQLKWYCYDKSKIIPSVTGRPGPCPCKVFQQSMHSICYVNCTGIDNKTYFTATLVRARTAPYRGDWGLHSDTVVLVINLSSLAALVQ